MLIVTTPIEPVSGFAPNNPPPRFRSSRLSNRRRQHIERASSGSMSELTKFAKYGIPYLAVISQTASKRLSDQSKFFAML